MEGRWGRRISGFITRGSAITQFVLQLETREGNFITSSHRASNEDLEEFPELYGITLDKMVESIEEALERSKNMP